MGVELIYTVALFSGVQQKYIVCLAFFILLLFSPLINSEEGIILNTFSCLKCRVESYAHLSDQT